MLRATFKTLVQYKPMHAICLAIVVPFTVLGAVLAQPVATPTSEAGRIEVLFVGAPTANGPGHDPVTRYRVIKRNLGTEGIDFTYTQDPADAFNSVNLAKYDAVLFYGNWLQGGAMPADQLSSLYTFFPYNFVSFQAVIF